MADLYRPSPLDVRRLLALQRERADEALRAAKHGNAHIVQQIDRGLKQDGSKGRLSRWIAPLSASMDRKGSRPALRSLLLAVAEQDVAMLEEFAYVDALARAARAHRWWLRPVAQWRPRSHNVGRQFSSLLRHLLAKYPVPRVFDSAFLDGSAPEAAVGWFVHIGRGNNLRTAEALPFPLTRMMAHHVLLAADDLSVVQALRWGQVLGLGGSTRLAEAVIGSRLRRAMPDEPFWLTVVQFLVNNPMLDPRQIAPVVDFLFAQRFEAEPARIVDGVARAGGVPQPKLSMKGRTVDSLLRQVDAWHRGLARSVDGKQLWWSPSGIPPYQRVEGTPGNQRLFTIVELLTGRDLLDEGRAMRHCVGSYARSCQRGHCAIFSVREDDGTGVRRRITVEVLVRDRRIVQARGRCNQRPDPLDERLLRAWATTAGLAISQWARL